ncbi:DNA repair endonuclease XPF (DNA excision repair protein ERCC-4) [Durusdinium trenchii]|uniref:DNA repair endonuclease XPF (DNA excision repair protein ERCC-4) n=1 Tax=Durusdinium trenchii TaxID=1381693 RepID=A0ABP0HDY0_9DINO
MRALAFEKEMLATVLEEDCLTVTAKGLGHEVLLVKLMQLYCQQWDQAAKRGVNDGDGDDDAKRKKVPLVLLVNASGLADMLYNAIRNLGGPETQCSPPVVVTNKITSAERSKMYVDGGCFIVTSRILVVDLLSGTIDKSRITGVIVDKAHQITEKSNEGFILTILRSSKAFQGFVKAFSEAPEALATKFGFLSQVMGTLGVNKVHLWPRFHRSVRTVMDNAKPEVEELSQPLTEAMAGIQAEIVAALEMCLAELRRTENLDVSGLTVENGLFRSFEVSLRRQLDPLWHKVSRKTKQLVHDVGVLRKLLPDLLRFDAATMLHVLDNIKEEVNTNQAPSLWLLTDAADRIFQLAKRRVFRIKKVKFKPTQDQAAASNSNSNNKNKKAATAAAKSDFLAFDLPELLRGAVCLDESGRGKVRLMLRMEENPKYALLRHVLKEIQQKVEAAPPALVRRGGAHLVIFCRDRLTAKGIRARLCPQAAAELNSRHLETLFAARFKRFALAQGRADLCQPDAPRAALLALAEELHHKTSLPVETRLVCLEHLRRQLGAASGLQSAATVQPGKSFGLHDPAKGSSLRANTIVFPLNTGQDHFSLLEEVNPNFIVLFDPDVKTVRQAEVYQARHPSRKLRLYFLQYQDSAEEQRYLSDLKREQDTFKALIEEKAGIVLAKSNTVEGNAAALQDELELQQTKVVGYNLSTGEPIMASAMAASSSSSRSKGRVVPSIVVDMREFRSALPVMLFRSGIHIEPATIEVGDYILSPEICVERKSIPDLHGSFNSGRLFTQAEAMCRYYKRPNLLIEFDESKPFSLQAASEMHGEHSNSNILGKIVLLTTHFPNLRLLWSPSPHATVDLFRLMKANYGNPDVAVASKVTSETETAARSDTDVVVTSNTGAQELLRRLPGINVHNYVKVMRSVKNLRELSEMSLQSLTKLIGKGPAAKLFKFFNHEVDPMDESTGGGLVSLLAEDDDAAD